ncbi:uncharacterized protein [Blastocystis hominis]|uniref:Uncharacterized protein n=1 Tax=Blastocystis hominis TaxID=12968 RepID=D8LZM0_BLAHO|nr:uncharacterized protein [Blastocystis hominis]CBK21259.2 unnamed protein product [Blastocystis hominis]|eukprot:XP_012895307.1 uncharacterized protein [Blastocystis hominis]
MEPSKHFPSSLQPGFPLPHLLRSDSFSLRSLLPALPRVSKQTNTRIPIDLTQHAVVVLQRHGLVTELLRFVYFRSGFYFCTLTQTATKLILMFFETRHCFLPHRVLRLFLLRTLRFAHALSAAQSISLHRPQLHHLH